MHNKVKIGFDLDGVILDNTTFKKYLIFSDLPMNIKNFLKIFLFLNCN